MGYLGRIFTIGCLAFGAVGLTACGGSAGNGIVQGSGVMKTESVQISGFSAVNLTGAGKLIVEQTGTESLTIDAEDNILPLLDSKVVNNQLILGSKPNSPGYSNTKDIVFHVTVKDIGQIVVSGSGDAKATLIKSDMFNVEIGGSGNITIDKLEVTAQAVFKIGGSGEVNIGELQAQNVSVNIAGSGSVKIASGTTVNQLVSINASGNYEAEGLKSDVVQINASGSGNATVYADKTLDVLLNASGSVSYVGNATVTQTKNGSGTVTKKG